jgi:molybdopterin molybdotransferase
MTGAPLAPGTDTVIMLEYTTYKDAVVRVLKPAGKRQNVCKTAEDIKKGEKILSKHTLIEAAHIGLFAASGIGNIKIFKKPVVSVLNTGTEIIPAGRKLSKNKIYNSNGPMLCGLIEKDGFDFRYLGISRDKKSDLTGYIKKGLENDVLIISGGVSAGDYDLVPQVLKNLKVKKIFHKVCIKPGKPLFFGIKSKTQFFGLPAFYQHGSI